MVTGTVQDARKSPKTHTHLTGLNGNYVLNVQISSILNFTKIDQDGELVANISRN